MKHYNNSVSAPVTTGKLEIVPVGDKVVIKVHKVTETISGIHLPGEAAQSDYQTPRGTVVFIGPDCKQVKPGDVILCLGAQPAAKMYIGREQFVVINECDILGVLKSE